MVRTENLVKINIQWLFLKQNEPATNRSHAFSIRQLDWKTVSSVTKSYDGETSLLLVYQEQLTRTWVLSLNVSRS